jgi:hypothetical protein
VVEDDLGVTRRDTKRLHQQCDYVAHVVKLNYSDLVRLDGQDRAPPGLQPPRVATIPVYPDRQRVSEQIIPTSRTIPYILT